MCQKLLVLVVVVVVVVLLFTTNIYLNTICLIKSILQFIILGTYAYQELVKIIRHPEFKADQVPYSVTTLKKISKGLPLLPFTGTYIPINLKNIPLSSLLLKEAYTFSIKNHIHRIINNQVLMSKMYFGPGVEKGKKN